MNEYDVKKYLADLKRYDLDIVARKLNVIKYRKLSKIELESFILVNFNEKTIKKALKITWWDKYHNHIYGIISLTGVILSIIFFIFPILYNKSYEKVEAHFEIKNNWIDKLFYNSEKAKLNATITNISDYIWTNFTADLYLNIEINPKLEDRILPNTLFHFNTHDKGVLEPGKSVSFELFDYYSLYYLKDILSQIQNQTNEDFTTYIFNPLEYQSKFPKGVFKYPRYNISLSNMLTNTSEKFKKLTAIEEANKYYHSIQGADYTFRKIDGPPSAYITFYIVMKLKIDKHTVNKIFFTTYGWSINPKSEDQAKGILDFTFFATSQSFPFDQVIINNEKRFIKSQNVHKEIFIGKENHPDISIIAIKTESELKGAYNGYKLVKVLQPEPDRTSLLQRSDKSHAR